MTTEIFTVKGDDGVYTGEHDGVRVTARPTGEKGPAAWKLTAYVGESIHEIPAKNLKGCREPETLDTLVRLAREQEKLRLAATGDVPGGVDAPIDGAADEKVTNRVSYRSVVLTIIAAFDEEANKIPYDADRVLGRISDLLEPHRAKAPGGAEGPSRRTRDTYVAAGEVVPVDVLWKAGAARDLHKILVRAGMDNQPLTIEQIAGKLAELGHTEFKGLARYVAAFRRGQQLVPFGWFLVEIQELEAIDPAQPDKVRKPVGAPTYSIVPILEPAQYAAVVERFEVDTKINQQPTTDSTWRLPAEPML